MTDDDRLARLMREQVDARLRSKTAPPAFRPTNRRSRHAARGPWLFPLLAAACVAVMVGGTVGAVQLLSGPHRPAIERSTAPVLTPTATIAPPSHTTPVGSPSATATSTASRPQTSSAPRTQSIHSTPSTRTTTSTTRATSPSGPPPTGSVVVRAVTASGHAVTGYHVADETSTTTVCADASPVSVSAGIDWCGASAENTIACWKEAGRTSVLCLRDATRRDLVRQTLSGTYRAHAAPARPAPQVLVLSTGATCRIRVGGAGTSPSDHPGWVIWYFCSDGKALFGPLGGDGITRAHPAWTVDEYPTTGKAPGVIRTVRTVYYVGSSS